MEPLLHLYETLGIQVATNVPTLQSVDYDKDGTVDRSDTWAYTEQGRNTGQLWVDDIGALPGKKGKK